MAQGIAAGSKVVQGTEVGFSVATPILVTVPNVVRMRWSDATVTLKKVELVDRMAPEESREPRGTVLKQDPAAGSTAEIGTSVNLVVATPVTVLVPQLVGRTADAAAAELKRLELIPGPPRTKETRDATPGTVIDQSVPPGRKVEIGSSVSFVTAVRVTALVPPLVGRSREDATAAILKLELKPVDDGTDESRSPPGTVISQEPTPGTRLDIGSPVSFRTAVPVTVLVPNLVSKPIAEARRLLAAAELDVNELPPAEARVPPGSVLKQSIAAGDRVAIGTSVDLVTAVPVTVLAPSLVGRSEADARQALTALELVGNITYAESPAAAGTVQSRASPQARPSQSVPRSTLWWLLWKRPSCHVSSASRWRPHVRHSSRTGWSPGRKCFASPRQMRVAPSSRSRSHRTVAFQSARPSFSPWPRR